MAQHVDTTKPVDGATWAHKPFTPPRPGRHAEFFEGANRGRRTARRFDPTTWFAHSVQNYPTHNID